jgi:hypothetical protein
MVELNRSQREIRKAARDFAKGEFIKDMALEMEDQGAFPEKIWKKPAIWGFCAPIFLIAWVAADWECLKAFW